ncbi:SDR family NAD(P)-dependent oxidoreductase [Lachnospiraceae bacterium NSJ-143]|nr:SDR family NAD(P)-dependent oxidoreductase [Lachnospiraceae bacterium NSJ-143]
MNGKKIALVTGASGGLGREFAAILAKDSNIEEIWAIARNRKKLDMLEKKLGNKIKTFSVDLSDINDIKRFSGQLEESKPDISYLINNAGYAKFCSYDELNIDESTNMVNLNVNGVISMGLICIPYMKKGSHIINISSQAAFQPLPYQNIYSSTKAFIRNYSRALNVELRDRGISVTAVCPGWMDTDLYNRAEIGARKATNNFCGMVKPRKVALKALRDACKGRDMSVYSFYVKLAHFTAKVLPQRAMINLWMHQQRF